jgi:hypothetical protein
MDDDYLYFEGDPATDSARRRLERLMKEPERPRKWPWVVGALAAAAASWYFWPRRRSESAATNTESSTTRDSGDRR